MESIGAISARECLNPAETDGSGAISRRGGANSPIGMSEILRFVSEEKEARGCGEKRISTATTQQQRAYELIEAKLDAIGPQCRDATRDAEARATASYRDALGNCNRKRFPAKKSPLNDVARSGV
jgi:hypothetical protein